MTRFFSEEIEKLIKKKWGIMELNLYKPNDYGRIMQLHHFRKKLWAPTQKNLTIIKNDKIFRQTLGVSQKEKET